VDYSVSGGLPIDDLETLWERLADAIDAAGPEKSPLLLAKLALLMGNEIGDPATVNRLIEAAQRDMP
jgi:hypothetical protein